MKVKITRNDIGFEGDIQTLREHGVNVGDILDAFVFPDDKQYLVVYEEGSLEPRFLLQEGEYEVIEE